MLDINSSFLSWKCIHVTTCFSIMLATVPVLVSVASRAELMMMTISEIVNQLIEAHEKGEDANWNK